MINILKRSSKSSFIRYLILFWCAVFVGFQSEKMSVRSAINEVSFTSLSSRSSANDTNKTEMIVEELPCPSLQEFQVIAKEIHLKVDDEFKSCDVSPISKLARIFYLFKKIEINTLPASLNSFKSYFYNPYRFYSNAVKSTELSLEKSTAYATNISGKIAISAQLLNSNPLYVISTLMHEARHSDPDILGHEICRGGDIPKTNGGCDDEFTTVERDAGAYSFETLFLISWAKSRSDLLREQDRDFLNNIALSNLVNRFNKLPRAFAEKKEYLVALFEDGSLGSFDFDSKQWKTINLRSSQRVVKIERSAKNAGIILFKDNGSVTNWNLYKGEHVLSASIAPDHFVKAAGMFVLPGESNRTRFGVLNDKNLFFYNNFHPELMRSKLDLVREKTQLNNIKELPNKLDIFFMGLFGDTYFIDTKGKLIKLANDPLSEEMWEIHEGLNNKRWRYGTGGYFYENLYLISTDGELFEGKADYREIDEYRSETIYSVNKLNTDFEYKITKFQDGISYKGYLLEDGSLRFAKSIESKNIRRVTVPKKVKDFAFVQHPVIKTEKK